MVDAGNAVAQDDFDPPAGRAPLARVVDQVGDDAFESTTVDEHEGIADTLGDLNRRLFDPVAQRRRAHRLVHEFGRRQRLHHQGHGAGVAARHLQEVFHE